MLKFLQKKSKEPEIRQKQICDKIGYSDSTLSDRETILLKIVLTVEINREKKLLRKQNPKLIKQLKILETVKKNDLKSGSVLQNNDQEDNTKFISLARKKIDNNLVFIVQRDKIELEIKRAEKKIIGIAEKVETVANTNMVTKKELLHKFVAKHAIKNKMITEAEQMFIE